MNFDRINKKPAGSNPFVAGALAGFSVFGSSTPEAFLSKLRHVNLVNAAIVFTDVLRASSTLHAAITCGCHGIFLTEKPKTGGYNNEPPALREERWKFGGEENGQPIPGAALDNSPGSVMAVDLNGAFLKFYSTNGAKALQNITDNHIGDVFLMSLANVESTVEALMSGGYDQIWFVCGGFYGSASLEDSVCCGRAIRHLVEASQIPLTNLDDEARVMVSAAAEFHDDKELLEALMSCQVAKLLDGLGKISDVAVAVTGATIESIWPAMQRTVVKLEVIAGIPLLRAAESAKSELLCARS